MRPSVRIWGESPLSKWEVIAFSHLRKGNLGVWGSLTCSSCADATPRPRTDDASDVKLMKNIIETNGVREKLKIHSLA